MDECHFKIVATPSQGSCWFSDSRSLDLARRNAVHTLERFRTCRPGGRCLLRVKVVTPTVVQGRPCPTIR